MTKAQRKAQLTRRRWRRIREKRIRAYIRNLIKKGNFDVVCDA